MVEPTLIIDTREQQPLDFTRTKTFNIDTQKLDFGDYGLKINDKIVPIVFERKSPLDLFGTLTHGHKRFKAEIQRAIDVNFKFYIIVECSYSDIINKNFKGSYYTKQKGFVLIKAIHTIERKYNIRFIFVNDRAEAVKYISNTFKTYVK